MTIQTNNINEKQNEPESLELLRANDAAYMYARWAESFRFLLALIGAGAAVFATLQPGLGVGAAIGGLVIGGVSEFVRQALSLRWTRIAMLLQECLDTALFALPWDSSIGQKPLHEDRRYWDKRFRGNPASKRNWYIDVSGLPRGHAVLLCQRENLSWDARLRGLWGAGLLALSALWVTLGFALGIRWEWKVLDLVARWIAPSTPLLLFAITSALSNYRIASRKRELIGRTHDLLVAVPLSSAQGQNRVLSAAREFQTHIARLRSEETRVPNWLYMLLRSEYEDEAATAAKSWRDDLARAAREGLGGVARG